MRFNFVAFRVKFSIHKSAKTLMQQSLLYSSYLPAKQNTIIHQIAADWCSLKSTRGLALNIPTRVRISIPNSNSLNTWTLTSKSLIVYKYYVCSTRYHGSCQVSRPSPRPRLTWISPRGARAHDSLFWCACVATTSRIVLRFTIIRLIMFRVML